MNFSDFKHLNVSHFDAQTFANVSGAMDPAAPGLWHEIAMRLFLVMSQNEALKAIGADSLAQVAVNQVYQVAYDFGGDTMYLGIGEKLRVAEINRKVVADFNGKNVAEVARETGITASRVRQILREHRRVARLRQQSLKDDKA